MATEIEYGVNDDQGVNPFDKNFDTQTEATEAGKQFLRDNPDVAYVALFKLFIIDSEISHDERIEDINRTDLERLDQAAPTVEVRDAFTLDSAAAAVLFFDELHASVETLVGLAEHYGVRTLADLMYLQNAILDNTFIDHWEDESSVLEIVSALPNGKHWKTFVKPA